VRAIRYEDMIANPSSALLMAADPCEISIDYDHAIAIARDAGCAALLIASSFALNSMADRAMACYP
jgi:hypothetical protein